MDSVRLREYASRLTYRANLLPDNKKRARLLDLAREARVRAAAKEHGLLDSDPPATAGVPQALPRRYKPRRRAA